MKTAKQKAKELVLEFNKLTVVETIHYPNGKIIEGYSYAKQCALITVDEILIAITYADYGIKYLNERDFWEEVKDEIQKL